MSERELNDVTQMLRKWARATNEFSPSDGAWKAATYRIAGAVDVLRAMGYEVTVEWYPCADRIGMMFFDGTLIFTGKDWDDKK